MNNLLIPSKIIKSKRKSIALIIENDGNFIVRAPLKSTDDKIYAFIQEKANWIIKKRQEQLNNKQVPINFENTQSITLLGKEYNIILTDAKNVKVAGDKIYIPKQDSKNKLVAYLKKLAKKIITEQCNELANKFYFGFKSISINSAKSRWGSCSETNKLHFTYKLMLCPMEIIQYIIIHELCHTVVKNHSKKFWELVEKCYPEYKQCEKWLKKNRAIVEII